MASEQEASDPKKQNPYKSYLKYSSLGLQLLATLAVFGWLGYKLDQWLELTFPVFLLTFVMLAFGGMMYHLYRSLDKN